MIGVGGSPWVVTRDIHAAAAGAFTAEGVDRAIEWVGGPSSFSHTSSMWGYSMVVRCIVDGVGSVWGDPRTARAAWGSRGLPRG